MGRAAALVSVGVVLGLSRSAGGADTEPDRPVALGTPLPAVTGLGGPSGELAALAAEIVAIRLTTADMELGDHERRRELELRAARLRESAVQKAGRRPPRARGRCRARRRACCAALSYPARVGREIRAVQIAIASSSVGALTKFAVGMVTGSMAMISSAVDSLGDLFVSIVNLFVVRYSDRSPDEDHNYGHAKIEGLGAMFEGGFIFAAGGFIIYESIHKALIGEASHQSALGIAVMVPVLVMTAATVVYLRRVARETGSLVVRSDALHYATDVYVNIGVLVALVLVHLTGQPLVDTFISIGIALYMLFSSLHVVRAGFDVVMDRSLDADTVKKLTAALDARTEIDSFHDVKTRQGRIPHVDFHIVVRPDMTATELHDLFMSVQTEIRTIVGPSTKVLVHADPAGA